MLLEKTPGNGSPCWIDLRSREILNTPSMLKGGVIHLSEPRITLPPILMQFHRIEVRGISGKCS